MARINRLVKHGKGRQLKLENLTTGQALDILEALVLSGKGNDPTLSELLRHLGQKDLDNFDDALLLASCLVDL